MFRSRRPEKSRRGKFWYWVNPALGKEVNAWLVGAMVGAETHHLGRTQPCRFYTTGGRMTCYCTKAKLEAVWKGYLPLRDENGVQCFAIIGERFAELAEKIPLWSPVVVTRLKQAGQPIAVKPSNWTDAQYDPPEGRGRPVDFRPIMLKLWKDEELIKWLADHPDAGDGEAAPGPLERRVGPMMKAAARRVEQTPDTAGGVLDEVLRGVTSKNGKH